ncbi:MAG: hypothetical protein KY459_06075 [Acidobacteria bacterium]|nr:hypothetical protein [Acidobacteriota bacterium]
MDSASASEARSSEIASIASACLLVWRFGQETTTRIAPGSVSSGPRKKLGRNVGVIPPFASTTLRAHAPPLPPPEVLIRQPF